MTRRKKVLVGLGSFVAVLMIVALVAWLFSIKIVVHFLLAPQHDLEVYSSPALNAAHT